MDGRTDRRKPVRRDLMLTLKNLKFRFIFDNESFKIFIFSFNFNNQKTEFKVELENFSVTE